MSNEKVTQLPGVVNAALTDIIYAVQGGLSVQETLQQVSSLMLSNTILSHAGNPNGVVAGTTFQLLWDTTNSELWICTTSGSSSTAVWSLVASSASGVIPPSRGGTGVANPTSHSIPVAEGASNFNFLTLAAGQVLIGTTSSDPSPATITGSGGINVASTSGAINISGTGSSLGWNNAPTSTNMVAESGYVSTGGSLVTLTLPVTAAFGTALGIIGQGAGGWSIAQNSGQNIQVGNVSSTVGVGGSVSSTNRFDSIYLICVVANTTWQVLGAPQAASLTIV